MRSIFTTQYTYTVRLGREPKDAMSLSYADTSLPVLLGRLSLHYADQASAMQTVSPLYNKRASTHTQGFHKISICFAQNLRYIRANFFLRTFAQILRMKRNEFCAVLILHRNILKNCAFSFLHSGGWVCLENLGGSCLHSSGLWRPGLPSLVREDDFENFSKSKFF